MFPVVSSMVTTLFLIIFPVVPLKRAMASAVEELGPVTSPVPPGMAHVPSPRQNVVEEALVPLLRFVTGKLPVTPVVNGNPVQLVSVPDEGVPNAGVVKLGDVVMATLPDPEIVYSPRTPALSKRTLVVAPPVIGVVPMVRLSAVPEGVAQDPSPRQNVVAEADVPELRFPTGRLPVTPVDRGNPVAWVSTAADGVPKAGVVRLGDVARTTAPVPVTPLERSLAANCETLTAPPTVD